MGVTVAIEYKPTPVLDRLLSHLGEQGRKTLEAAGAENAAATTRSWLLQLAADRHRTAEKLEARPTGIIRRTAVDTRAEERDGAQVVVVPHPLFRRAFRDVEIAPRSAQALAIPVAKASYGRLPRTMGEMFVWRKDRTKEDKGTAFLARTKGKGKNQKLELLFLLYRGRISQKQDPSLLPGKATLGEAAMKGVKRRLGAILRAVKSAGGSV